MLDFAFRDIIRNAVNASELDAVIFVSSGVTGSIHKLIHAMNMQKPPVSSKIHSLPNNMLFIQSIH